MTTMNTSKMDAAYIKECLHRYLYEQGHWVEDEFVMNDVRADIVTLNDEGIDGYEIKSDLDSTARLPNQIRGYDKVCRTCTLVCSREMLVKCGKHLPDHWGALLVLSDGSFLLWRKPWPNPNFNINKFLGLLWTLEIKAMLRYICLKTTGAKRDLIGRLAAKAATVAMIAYGMHCIRHRMNGRSIKTSRKMKKWVQSGIANFWRSAA